MADDAVAKADYGWSRTVVNIQRYYLCIRVELFEFKNELAARTVERINRLIIVADDHQIMLRMGNHFDQLILQCVRILEFVDHYILELLL
ncbi:hypothetical protein D3C74_405440 [compost metagenome]